MTNKKNKFFTFCFSMIPGAGEMYLGFYKMGISLMLLFWGSIAIGGFLNLGISLFFLPVIWFYSFFHVHNLNALPDEEFYALQDMWLVPVASDMDSINGWLRKFKRPLSVLVILMGFSMLWNVIMNVIHRFANYFSIPDEFYPVINTFSDAIPQAILAVAVILAGFYLIRSKKEALQQEEDSFIPSPPYLETKKPQNEASCSNDTMES